MKIFIKRLITITMALAMFLAVSAQAQEIVFGDAGWDSMKFHNAVAMLIAEEAYGMSTREVSGSTAITYNALKTGDIHIYTVSWTDNIAPYQQDVEDGKVIELGITYADNIQGMYVPRYVIQGDESRGIEAAAPDLKTVADLKDYAGIFQDPEDPGKGRIYGAISSWAIDDIMRKKVAYYGLDEIYNYMDPGSDPALAAAIAGAYEKGEPIVAYYWEPAWITGKYDLVLLEDAPYEPEGYLKGETACPSIPLTVAVNPDFYEANLEYSEFLSNYYSSSALTSEALAFLSENDASYEEAARWFLKEHGDMIDDWLPEDKAALVRAALD